MDQTSLIMLMHDLGLGSYLPVILAVIGVASALASILPHPAPGSVWVIPRNALDLIAMNFGRAKNAIAPASVTAPPPAVIALLCVGLAVSACATVTTPAQTVFAAEQAYTTLAHAEVLAGPLMQPNDRAAMVHVDDQVYVEIVRLRVSAANGTASAVEAQAALDAVHAAIAAINKVK